MEQSERISEFDRFKRDEITILVASDVAARGLDVKGVRHVFNFDVPWQPDDYVHRIGRTGRAGAKGTAITLATRADAEGIERIEKLTGQKIPSRLGAPDQNPQRGQAGTKEGSAETGATCARAFQCRRRHLLDVERPATELPFRKRGLGTALTLES